jgi:hypothetical protein
MPPDVKNPCNKDMMRRKIKELGFNLCAKLGTEEEWESARLFI